MILRNIDDANDALEIDHAEELFNYPGIVSVYTPAGHGFCIECAVFGVGELDGSTFERRGRGACVCENCGKYVENL